MRKLFHGTGAVFSFALSLVFALLMCAALGLALWSQSDRSLAHALQLAGSLLPAGQTLSTRDVSGSVASGGHIGQLRWQKSGMAIEVQDLEVGWDWHAAFYGELRVATLHARTVRVDDHGPASSAPIAELTLPLHVDLQFVVDRLDWAGPPALLLEGLRGHYRFDGLQHTLDDARLSMAAGSYEFNAALQGKQPMALSVQANGTVQTPVKIQQAPLQVLAQATLKGTLFGPDALLDLRMDLKPQGAAAARLLGAANLQARLKPGQPQPLDSAIGQWTALDLASLWPQAPRTSLSGQVQVAPDGAGWKADIETQNRLSGPLDQQRLPLQSAQALVLYRNGQWQLSSLQAAIAGGKVQAQGAYAGQPAQWSATGSLQGVQPAQLDTRWTGGALNGSVTARQTPTGIGFDTELRAENSNLSSSKAQITHLLARGQWKAPTLQLETLLLEGRDARIEGQLNLDTGSYASSGRLRASVPGALINVDGNAAPAAGQGNATVQISDADALLHWLATVPVVGASLRGNEAQGVADLSLHWSGGWEKSGANLQLQVLANAKRIELNKQRLSDLQLDLSGTPAALAMQFSGKADVGTQQLTLQTLSHAAQTGAGKWQATVDTLQLLLNDGQQAKPWTMQLQRPLKLDYQQGAQGRTFSLAEGALRLSAPSAGTAQIQWQPLLWSQALAVSGQTAGAARWSSKGQLQGVPLAWLELLGQTRMANLGLRGDLVFGGQWDASSGNGNGLRVNASVQRTAGDLQLLHAEGGTTLSAGLRDAHATLQIDGEALQVSLVWASDAGGNAKADFTTRLQTVDGTPHWAADAPLQGSVHASLPRVGVWSLVAPVGWRIQGTMEADANLTGSRSKPVWKGTLAARDMAIRSVVDGIDFSNGVLRLQVNGQHMDITELTLQGAGGASGGKLVATGSVDWLPGMPGSPIASRLRMALDAQAQALRVTTRPDQRLVVTGNLAARLIDERLVLRGVLKADQALFVLPEDTAPKLGADVVVRAKPSAAKAAQIAATDPPATSTGKAQSVVLELNIVLDPGPNFLVQGHGLSTRLSGLLTLQAEGRGATPRLTGELRTINGTYRAYGQRLNIDQGTLRFSGAYDNPALDIRALRPNLQQVVGVEISGTAQLPVVRLYSDPDLPEAEKLSWLVLGRASSNGGAETALLQQAALALLSGKGRSPTDALFTALGLDEVSLGQAATTNLDGSTGTEATVKLGKRISRDFYVAYERSLAGTLGTFYVFYDLSRRFTLRAESGAQNAVDLIFTTRYD